jgi:hypothetical protein
MKGFEQGIHREMQWWNTAPSLRKHPRSLEGLTGDSFSKKIER